jgi:hypothetical protein
MAGEDWTLDEVEAIVGDYFVMLRAELAGQPFNKAAHNRSLRASGLNRSRSSIENKHQNISAVLRNRGIPYIDGYKPYDNYQRLIESAVLEYLASAPHFFEQLLHSSVLEPTEKPAAVPQWNDVTEDAPEPVDAPARVWDLNARLVPFDFVRRDAENRRLGRLGEKFVIELERKRLHDHEQRPDLAKRVEWTSQERGDGARYDIHSFESDERPRYIEVKTTGLAKAFPFQVTANEVACSAALRDEYHLYRVFRFSRNPRVVRADRVPGEYVQARSDTVPSPIRVAMSNPFFNYSNLNSSCRCL